MSDQVALGAPADLSALAWVADELRRTLENAHKALRRQVRETEGAPQGSEIDGAASAALLQAAVAGSVVPELGALLTAIGTADQGAVEAARAELIRVGPGSGASTAAGALQQFERLRRTVRRAA